MFWKSSSARREFLISFLWISMWLLYSHIQPISWAKWKDIVRTILRRFQRIPRSLWSAHNRIFSRYSLINPQSERPIETDLKKLLSLGMRLQKMIVCRNFVARNVNICHVIAKHYSLASILDPIRQLVIRLLACAFARNRSKLDTKVKRKRYNHSLWEENRMILLANFHVRWMCRNVETRL